MGNIGSSFFATPQEKEFRKLTKKNTKVNRVSLGHVVEEPSAAARKGAERQRRPAGGSLRFDNLITEVSYDREEGEIEVVRQHLNRESEDALGEELIKDLVPTTVPVVSAEEGNPSDVLRRRPGAILKREGSFVTAHAHRLSESTTAAQPAASAVSPVSAGTRPPASPGSTL
jgi:hypothetical protein